MESFSRNHGSIKVILQGFGVGVRTDKSYVLFERTDEDLPVKKWAGPPWNCTDAERCFEDARSRLELYPPAGGGAIARMQILSNNPTESARWFETHLGLRIGEGRTPIQFVPFSGALPAGDLIDHIAFSYPDLASAVKRLHSERRAGCAATSQERDGGRSRRTPRGDRGRRRDRRERLLVSDGFQSTRVETRQMSDLRHATGAA